MRFIGVDPKTGRDIGQTVDALTGLTPEERAVGEAVRAAPKLKDRVKDVVGKAWNAPNTAIGLTLGGLGHVAGAAKYALGAQDEKPRVAVGSNAVQFMNNPVSPLGGLTIGNATIYGDDPYSEKGRREWAKEERKQGHPVWEHEKQHTYQGQLLGPLYLPANLVGGMNAMLRRQDWHGDHNFMERGPKSHPARPWRGMK